MNNFDSQVFDVMSKILIFSLELAGEVDVPKRSGDFETKYKTATGTEVTVKRSPDGKFANKNGGQTTNQSSSAAMTTTTTVPVAKTFAKQFADFGDEIAKMPAKAQDVMREAVFNSELSESINAETAKFVKKINNPIFTAGFNLGQRIRDELAKKPFSKFGETVTAKFEEFRKNLPQKSENLRKEIVRIATDPNTGTIITAGALMGLAGAFQLAGLFSAMRAGGMAFALLRLPNVATRAAQLVAELTPEFAGKLTEIEIKSLAEMTAYTTLSAQKAMGAATVAGGLIMATVYNVVGGILTSHVGRAIMNRVKSNEVSEKEALKTKIRETPENADDLYQGMADKSAKDQETKRKILAGLRQQGASQEEWVNTIMAFELSTLSIDVSKKEEDYLTNNPQESSRIFQKVYEDASVKSLFAELDTAMAIELQTMFADNPVPQSESQVDALKKKIDATVTKLVKAEIAQTSSNRATTELAKGGGVDAKGFGKKEDAIKQLVAEEGLKYEEVLQAIARRKEEPPNPKKAEKAQEQILELERESQDGAVKVAEIIRGKLGLNSIEMEEVLSIAKKEPQIRNKIIEKRGELEQAEGRGFSISRRLNELADIAAKEGKDSPSYKWRMNTVKAEVEYGDELDGLADPGGYDKLLSAMKKPKPAPGNYETPNATDNSAITKLFDAGGSPARTPVNLRPKILENASNAGLELQNYLATPINAQVGLVGGMTCAFPGSNNKYSQIVKDSAELDPTFKVFTETAAFKDKNIDGLINVGDVSLDSGGQKLQGYNSLASTEEHIREMMWHESGHLLEVKLGKVAESVAFREERSQEVPSDRKVVPPQGLSAGSQDYALGEFYSPYIGLRIKGQGKYANTDRATEVLSSGMELLSSPSMAKRAAKADRETMLYALAAMNEKIKD